jgi:hypothetical protein
VLRPSAYLETWAAVIGTKLAAGGPALVFGHGTNPINFISVRDVAAIAERAITDPTLKGQTIDLPGPDNLTMNQFAELLAATHLRRIPRPLLRAMSVTAAPLAPALARQAAARGGHGHHQHDRRRHTRPGPLSRHRLAPRSGDHRQAPAHRDRVFRPHRPLPRRKTPMTRTILASAWLILAPAVPAQAAPNPNPVAPAHTGTACATVLANNPQAGPDPRSAPPAQQNFFNVGAVFCGIS